MKKKKIFKIIAIYQVIGGVLGFTMGLLTLLNLIFSTPDIPTNLRIFTIIMVLLAIILFILSFLAGILLEKKNKLGIKISIINQFLQIPRFSIFGFSYFFVAGLHFAPGIKENGFLFLWHLGSYFEITFNVPTFLAINLIPIVILFFLFKNKNYI